MINPDNSQNNFQKLKTQTQALLPEMIHKANPHVLKSMHPVYQTAYK